MKWHKLALALGSLLLALVLAEAMTRLFVPVRMVGSSFSVYDPVEGKKLKPNFETTRTTQEFTIRFSTNSEGHRGPEPSANRPILFLGDSFTMGYGVSDGEEFPALVRDALAVREPAVPVVNAGMGDNGNGRWIKFLRTKGRGLEPRAVVFQLMSNDFIDNQDEGLFELSEDQELIELQVPPIEPIRMVQNVVDAVPGLADSHLAGLMYQAYVSAESQIDSAPIDPDSRDYPFNEADLLTYKLLQEAIDICQDSGWPMIAILVGIDGNRLAEIERRLRAHQVPVIRTPGRRERPDLYYALDGHWNPTGHALVAESVLAEIRKLDIR